LSGASEPSACCIGRGEQWTRLVQQLPSGAGTLGFTRWSTQLRVPEPRETGSGANSPDAYLEVDRCRDFCGIGSLSSTRLELDWITSADFDRCSSRRCAPCIPRTSTSVSSALRRLIGQRVKERGATAMLSE
jgi:hypothetical protein